MRAVIQRVKRGAVAVEDELISKIDRGLVVFVGVTLTDGEADTDFLAHKIANLRIFDDDAGKFNLSAIDVNAEILIVSQFTLHAEVRKGRRPDFGAAARPDQAEPLIDSLAVKLGAMRLRVEKGKFRAHMLVEIWNDGPVTILLDSQP